ncbi:MOSC domain-containing protein [Nitratidesulfovibrio sp. D1]|uniref:MOSC domain-containing protein n=1 Tax=Nitratidesulfovibrio sp. D1 TaxID=3440151 RepID=UPI003EBF51F0
MGIVRAVCISERKGERKRVVDSITLREDYGVEEDAHGGSGRQVSLLAVESVDVMRPRMPELAAGDFAENILVEGLPLTRCAVGDRLTAGPDILLEITQIGKTCHSKCNIHKTVGFCIMPTEGVFARVLRGGVLRAGDAIDVTAG